MKINAKIFLLVLISVALFAGSCKKHTKLSDAQKKYFIKFFGNATINHGYDLVGTADGGFIIAGTITEDGRAKQMALIKTDEYGNKQWQKTFGDNLDDVGKNVKVATDGGYIIAGTYTDGVKGTQMYIVKTDAQGNEQWNKKIGTINKEEGNSIVSTSDGGYIIAGSTTAASVANNNPLGNQDVLLLKIKSNGDSAWAKTFGGSGNDFANGIKQKSDGGFIVVGTTESFSEPGQAGTNALVIETNVNGDIIDRLTYGGTSSDVGSNIKILSDGSYIFVGTTNSLGAGGKDVYVVKLNKNIHEIAWTKTFGTSSDEEGSSISITSDNGYVLAGYSTVAQGNTDAYIVKIDAAGNKTWENSFGDVDNETAESIIQTSDGKFVFTGSSGNINTQLILLAKISANGKLEP